MKNFQMEKERNLEKVQSFCTNKDHLSSIWLCIWEKIIPKALQEDSSAKECGCCWVLKRRTAPSTFTPRHRVSQRMSNMSSGEEACCPDLTSNPMFKKLFQLRWPYLWTCYQSHFCSVSGVARTAHPQVSQKVSQSS